MFYLILHENRRPVGMGVRLSGSREVLCAETAELVLASGATELWQHPGHVGPGESQSLLAINSIPSRNTEEVNCCLEKADAHLCSDVLNKSLAKQWKRGMFPRRNESEKKA
ncbi:hypothetical protein EK904_001200 [Melospiza melodia maxima]|nr:hypothetical protein EK904_001200 [Melospiza melodia maxima]